MKVQKIAVDKCFVPEVRVTAVYDEELQKLLTDTIDTMGQIQPIIVVQDGESFIVTDGKHRLEEAIRKGQPTIDAVVYQGDQKSALLQNLVLNRVHGKTKASEMVRVIQSLFEDFNLGIEDIQKETNLSRGYIEKLLQISTASPIVRELLDQEVIGVGAAFEISRLPQHDMQEMVAQQTEIYRWTVPALKEQVDGVLSMIKNPEGEPVQAPLPPVREYRCEICRQITPLDNLRPVNSCPDCYSAVYQVQKDRQAKLEAEVKKSETG